MTRVRGVTKELEDWIKDNLRYDPDTGHLWWLKENASGPKRNFGRPAGYKSGGYLLVDINIYRKSTIRLHRVAWFLYYGVWPKDQIDHINNVRDDNRIVNLREATARENQSNMKIRKGGTSQYKGVSWDKRLSKWRTRVMSNSKSVFLGHYDNEEEAALAYNKAALELFGEFAKINDVTP